MYIERACYVNTSKLSKHSSCMELKPAPSLASIRGGLACRIKFRLHLSRLCTCRNSMRLCCKASSSLRCTKSYFYSCYIYLHQLVLSKSLGVRTREPSLLAAGVASAPAIVSSLDDQQDRRRGELQALGLILANVRVKSAHELRLRHVQ